MTDTKKKVLLVSLCLALVFYIILFLGQGLKEEIAAVKAYNSHNSEPTYFVYFAGIGCPHCSKTSPVLLDYKVKNSNVMVIEYEIYKARANAPIMAEYAKKYDTGIGVPMLIAGKDDIVSGAKGLLLTLNETIDNQQGNKVLLPTGEVAFEELNLAALKGMPRIWYKNRLAIRKKESDTSEEIKTFLIDGSIPEGAEMYKHPPKPVEISGDKVSFKYERYYKGWSLRWN